MVVEDDPTLQIFYTQVIKLNGLKLMGVANNGEQAISMYASFKKKPSVILMDYRMPIKNGIEASKEILKMNPKQKIIFTTADNEIKEQALDLGIVDFKCKPFTVEDIIKTILKVAAM